MWHCKLRYGSVRQFSSTLAVYVLTRTRVWPLTSAVCEHGAPYSPYLNKFPDGAELGPTNRSWTPTNFSRYPYGPQDDKFSYHNGARDNAIEMFNSTQLPIKAAVAKEFAVFNHLHGSVPSYSTPNHLYWGFGSSCGLSTNPRCNASSYEPPAHIFDSLHAANVSYRSYSNDSAASPPTGGNSSGSACPYDLMFNASRRHKDHCTSMDAFYADAAAVRNEIACCVLVLPLGPSLRLCCPSGMLTDTRTCFIQGTLPAFSYLTPPFEASDHPW